MCLCVFFLMPPLKLSMAPSSLLLSLVLSVWVALPLPRMITRVVVAAGGQGGEQCPPVLCGDVNISYPFGLIPDNAAQTSCGAGIGFQVRCTNNTPSLGYYQTEHGMNILSIFYHNQSLLITDYHWQGYFNSSTKRCTSFPTNTSTRLARPFSISSVNQNLIFYNCADPPPPGVELAEPVCHQNHNTTFVRAADEPPGESGSYILEGCTAVFASVLGVPVEVNNYQQLVRNGFLATYGS